MLYQCPNKVRKDVLLLNH